ncbi:UNKNOWN [Stylonychia lemnae]|uniref:Peptidase C14 caspase domain-containing protein n=1 Tax=Stylonychia lemnae TaxID=5949 RepID=A0A078B7M0_STYLE|nr:UNKNOWN [Stylonychia lemnae]|eukprot:CDW89548.1 UNKNOWN [Stylonychia lemnae]
MQINFDTTKLALLIGISDYCSYFKGRDDISQDQKQQNMSKCLIDVRRMKNALKRYDFDVVVLENIKYSDYLKEIDKIKDMINLGQLYVYFSGYFIDDDSKELQEEKQMVILADGRTISLYEEIKKNGVKKSVDIFIFADCLKLTKNDENTLDNQGIFNFSYDKQKLMYAHYRQTKYEQKFDTDCDQSVITAVFQANILHYRADVIMNALQFKNYLCMTQFMFQNEKQQDKILSKFSSIFTKKYEKKITFLDLEKQQIKKNQCNELSMEYIVETTDISNQYCQVINDIPISDWVFDGCTTQIGLVQPCHLVIGFNIQGYYSSKDNRIVLVSYNKESKIFTKIWSCHYFNSGRVDQIHTNFVNKTQKWELTVIGNHESQSYANFYIYDFDLKNKSCKVNSKQGPQYHAKQLLDIKYTKRINDDYILCQQKYNLTIFSVRSKYQYMFQFNKNNSTYVDACQIFIDKDSDRFYWLIVHGSEIYLCDYQDQNRQYKIYQSYYNSLSFNHGIIEVDKKQQTEKDQGNFKLVGWGSSGNKLQAFQIDPEIIDYLELKYIGKNNT